MNDYKVGDKVETPFGVGVVEKIYDSGCLVSFSSPSKMITNKDIKTYKPSLVKLIEKGFRWNPFYNHYERPHSVIGNLIERISVYKGIKKIQTNFEYDLDFSKILTQYLE